MSAYRVEVHKGRNQWVRHGTVRAKDSDCAIRQVMRKSKGVTAVKVEREYKEVNCEA